MSKGTHTQTLITLNGETILIFLQEKQWFFSPNPVPLVPSGYQKGVPAAPRAPRKSNVELLLENFIATQTQQNKEFANQHVHTNELMKQISRKLDVMATHKKMLETQISQVSQQ